MAKRSDENGRIGPDDRDSLGRFVPGNPGGPGSPPGATRLRRKLEKILDEDADNLAAIFKGLLDAKDAQAWRLALDRVWPATQHHEHSGNIGLGPEDTEALEARLDRLSAERGEEGPSGFPPSERVSGPH